MKRRAAECGKLRRPPKRNKITDGIYGSSILYLRFLVLWAMVLAADFLLEFRFEFLWPFWLLIRSVYDSFKYQGLAFSVFFICIALTSDMICYFFIPVNWLFFAASTYVWVQYVWHTDKGVCVPTVILWLMFLYVEVAIRLKDLRLMPFHLDLCRPFAAHCIGYPVVTLGFGFKSYVGYRMRQRKQRDVAKENEFYLQLLQQALPVEQQPANLPPQIPPSHVQIQTQVSTTVVEQNSKSQPQRQSVQYNPSPEKGRGVLNNVETNLQNGAHNNIQITSHIQNSNKTNQRKSVDKVEKQEDQHNKHNTEKLSQTEKNDKKYSNNGSSVSSNDLQYIEKISPVNDFDSEVDKDKTVKGSGHNSVKTVSNVTSNGKWSAKDNKDTSNSSNVREKKGRQAKLAPETNNEQQKLQDEYCQRITANRKLEAEVKRLKSDVQANRSIEQDLKCQINSLMSSERQAKSDIQQLQHDNELLQNKIHGLNNSRQMDKQTISTLERKLVEERRQRQAVETNLNTERRNRRIAEEQLSAVPPPPPPRQECTDSCKTRRTQMEQELKKLRRELSDLGERCKSYENKEAYCMEHHSNHASIMATINNLRKSYDELQQALSAETRIKLDLFSALGEAKRELEIKEKTMQRQEKDLEQLKAVIAQDLAVMPQKFGPTPPTCSTSKLRGLNNDVNVVNMQIRANESPCPGCTVSNLDPNATAYTPKTSSSSLVASTAT
ncbi:macoilin-1-like isoform X2 [Trichogramma pretiosum]|uniref:macoilin-1-like isoform X2 n=1 Tax=Trichogramma pretiosum TaxID=7493 RepID=UPI0006C94B1D|nr:macoilin-1-like isoform X2 [Trichogramma pretiosum]